MRPRGLRNWRKRTTYYGTQRAARATMIASTMKEVMQLRVEQATDKALRIRELKDMMVNKTKAWAKRRRFTTLTPSSCFVPC
mmetsp:Transcript_80698/g.224603  ORF Transcript_80698/g.224603 Transcript_80698/m.224603 type:complete len:82 (+) Transcript_80698:447-692(+)